MAWSLLGFGEAGWGGDLLRGLGVTVSVAVLAYAIGLVVGTLCGLLERRGGLLAAMLGFYASIIRSLPELLVVFVAYFGFAYIVETVLGVLGIGLQLEVSPFAAGVGALAAVNGAYTSEVIKGAAGGVAKDLIEAAMALGLSRLQTVRLITLPLALRLAFPGLANLWMVVIKTTPFLSAIQLPDLTAAAGAAGQNTKHFFTFYGVVLVGYLVLSGLSMLAIAKLSRRLARSPA